MTTNHDIKDLVNDDGTPTKLFRELWKADKEAVKANNLFLGKEGGQWLVKVGNPIYRVCRGGSTVQSGTHYSADTANKHRDQLIVRRAQPTYWVGRYGYADRAKALAKAGGNESAIRVEEGCDISAEVTVNVSYDRPKFGTPEERAARRQSWMALAEAQREARKNVDYRPSRWELNYNPTPKEDAE